MLTVANVAHSDRPSKVDRRVYSDPVIFQQEMERIFGVAWIYLGHESQVRAPGDYFLTRIGRVHVVVVRGSDGEVRAFHNRCPHRGVKVCVEAQGNAKRFVCPYHAWSFTTEGKLLGIPHAGGYSDLRERRSTLGLEPVARTAQYQGFIFGSLSATGPSLEDHLGPVVREAFDNFVDRAPEGTIEQVGGKLVQNFRANWKLQTENSIDLLHPPILHFNAIDAVQKFAATLPEGKGLAPALDVARSNGLSFEQWDALRIHALPNGHCYMQSFFQKDPREGLSDDERFGSDDQLKFEGQDEYIAALIRRHGRDKARQVLAFSRHNTIVYPNLFINPRIQQVRVLQPVSVNETEQHCYVFRLNGAPPAMFRLAVEFLVASNSPASIGTSDDHEIFERVQSGIESGESPWIDLTRGVDAEEEMDHGVTAPGTSELAMRNQHAAWRRYMVPVEAAA